MCFSLAGGRRRLGVRMTITKVYPYGFSCSDKGYPYGFSCSDEGYPYGFSCSDAVKSSIGFLAAAAAALG